MEKEDKIKIDFGKLSKKKKEVSQKPLTEFVPQHPIKQEVQEGEKQELTTSRVGKTIVVNINGKDCEVTSDLCRTIWYLITKKSARKNATVQNLSDKLSDVFREVAEID